MTDTHRRATRDHQEISAMLPWYVNGTLGERDRERIDEHLSECAGCRDELSCERRIHLAMNAAPAVEYMPAASLKRLQARLDGAAPAAETIRGGSGREPAAGVLSRRRLAPQGLLAASVVLVAVVITLLATDRWRAGAPAEPKYYTTTTAVPHPRGEVIRAVFSPDIRLSELQVILNEAQLQIVSGPTEAGVYSLAANSSRPVNSSLALLRRHAGVRFAESTQPISGSGDSP